MQSITGEDGRVHSIPFSVQADGAPLIPSAVRVVTPGVPEAIPEAIPWAGEPLDETVAQKPMAETVDKIESPDQPLEDAPAKKSRTLLECVAEASFALASGVSGAFDAHWLEETPSVPLAEASDALDRMLNQMKEMEKAAERSTSGPTYGLGTRVDSEASGPLPNVKKKTRPAGYAKLMQLRLLSTSTRPRPRLESLSRGCKALVLLASTIWMAAIAAATMDGMVPDPVNWDHMPRPEPTQGSGVPSAHPDTLPWQGYHWYDPNHTVTSSKDPNRDPGADPPEVGDRSSKFFTLKEVRSAVHRAQGHPMFDTAVVRRVKASTGEPVDSGQAPADVAALVWKELKLDNNPQLAQDPALREHALGMVGEIAAAFHKPDPLLLSLIHI